MTDQAEPERNRTCREHAQIMAALVPVAQMGPKLRALYDRFMASGDQECIAHESQVVMMFGACLNADTEAGHGPAESPPAAAK